MAEVLWNRGVRSRGAGPRFPRSGPRARWPTRSCSPAWRAAVDRLGRPLRERERVFVFGDFDADGTAAAALAIGVLRVLARRRRRRWTGAEAAGSGSRSVDQSRANEGFGLTRAGGPRGPRARRAPPAHGGLRDLGESGRSAWPANSAWTSIVADHHAPGRRDSPPATLVNPNLPGERYPFRDLAAVGVVHRILDALTRGATRARRAFLDEQLDLVALGTVADVVPLRGENRILTLARPAAHARGAAPRLAGARRRRAGSIRRGSAPSTSPIKLAPRLNAPGPAGLAGALHRLAARGGGSTRRGPSAAEVEDDNRERRDRHEKILKEALQRLEAGPRVPGDPIVLGSAAWSAGVLGIVASRLVETLPRAGGPGVAAGGDRARLGPHPAGARPAGLARRCAGAPGPVRGAPAGGGGLDASRAIRGVPRGAVAARAAPARGGRGAARRTPSCDPAACDLELARALERLAPFGAGNEEPLFLGGARVRAGSRGSARGTSASAAGRRARGARLHRLRAGDRQRDELPRPGPGSSCSSCPVVNRHRGEERLQLKLRAFRAAAGRRAGRRPGRTAEPWNPRPTPVAVLEARLREAVERYLPDHDTRDVWRALEFARAAHADQRRLSGEPYVTHCLSRGAHPHRPAAARGRPGHPRGRRSSTTSSRRTSRSPGNGSRGSSARRSRSSSTA